MKTQQLGFTITEVLVVVTIFAILAAVSAPNIRTFLQQNEATASTNQMVSNLVYARNEAAKRGFNVGVCVRNAAGDACGSSSLGYGAGVIIFTDYPTGGSSNGTYDTSSKFDLDGDGLRESSEEILHITESLPSGFSITSTNSAASSFVKYTPDGRAENAGVGTTFCIKDNTTLVGTVTLSMAGRVRSCRVKSGETCSSSC